jgi:hypothetical protein
MEGCGFITLTGYKKMEGRGFITPDNKKEVKETT